MDPMTQTGAGARPGAEPGRDPALPAAAPPPAAGVLPAAAILPAGRSRPASVAGLIVRAPLSRRARAELAYWIVALPLSVATIVPLIFLLAPGLLLTGSLAGAFIGLTLLALATRAGRVAGSVHRRAAAWTLAESVPAPAPFRPGKGVLGRLDARLRDAAGWRAVLYAIVKLPLAFAGLYFAAVPWFAGLFYLSYPFWWLVLPLQHRGPDGQVYSASISSPLPAGDVHITTLPEALAVCLLGAVLLLVAPWTTRLAVIVDLWLIRNLLGAAGHTERIRQLEASRALAVDDSAAMLRRVERDLHDGAQARLVALAMHLGRAQEQLGPDGKPPDVARARELLAAAHQGAKDALTELRDLARGIHPPVLDAGLEDALASLTSASATPATLSADIPVRPSPAIETIAYFCVAELLTNVAKHSRASHVAVEVRERESTLVLSVTDDGDGGARPRRGGGLEGLEHRVRTVDGTLRIASPAGGPTTVIIELPLQA
jgi:signal transduction histidine kinase